MKIHTLILALLVAAGLGLDACGGGSTDEGSGSGVVRGLDAEAGRITLEHGEIPGLMKPMTMAFDVADPDLLDGLEEGDRVEFEVRYADGRYTVTTIESR